MVLIKLKAFVNMKVKQKLNSIEKYMDDLLQAIRNIMLIEKDLKL